MYDDITVAQFQACLSRASDREQLFAIVKRSSNNVKPQGGVLGDWLATANVDKPIVVSNGVQALNHGCLGRYMWNGSTASVINRWRKPKSEPTEEFPPLTIGGNAANNKRRKPTSFMKKPLVESEEKYELVHVNDEYTEGQNHLVASSVESPHTVEDGRRVGLRERDQEAIGSPTEPKRVLVVRVDGEAQVMGRLKSNSALGEIVQDAVRECVCQEMWERHQLYHLALLMRHVVQPQKYHHSQVLMSLTQNPK